MRMWMVKTEILCRNHLLGEHREMHTFAGAINKRQQKLDGYVAHNCIEIKSLKQRHEDLCNEMIKRKYNHKTPFPELNLKYLNENIINAKVDRESSLKDLLSRCSECSLRAWRSGQTQQA